MKKYLLGIDNGLTGIKAVIFDTEGNEIASEGSLTSLNNNSNGIVVLDMQQLWEKTASIIKAVIDSSGVTPADIVAVGNSAHGNGLYPVDSDGRPVTSAILPMDLRASGVVDNWKDTDTDEKIFDLTLQKSWAGQPAAILHWLKENENQTYSTIHKVLFCKDWLKFKLTGEYSTDFSDTSAAGILDNNLKNYSSELFSLYGITECFEKLPEFKKSWEIGGFITTEASEITGLKEGTPVAVGMLDVNACCIGSGVYGPGKYSVIAGTWGINSVVSKEKIRSKNIVQCTVFADGENYLSIDSSPTSTVNLDWFLKKILNKDQPDYEVIEKIIAMYRPVISSPMFLPYVYPSIHHPKVSAGFYGLKAENTWEDMLCAVYEGIALGHFLQLERLRTCTLEGNQIVFTGGASKSKGWCKIFADVLGLPLVTVKVKQSGAMGAAIAAGISAGIFENVETAVKKMVKEETVFLPDSHNLTIYEERIKWLKKKIKDKDCF